MKPSTVLVGAATINVASAGLVSDWTDRTCNKVVCRVKKLKSKLRNKQHFGQPSVPTNANIPVVPQMAVTTTLEQPAPTGTADFVPFNLWAPNQLKESHSVDVIAPTHGAEELPESLSPVLDSSSDQREENRALVDAPAPTESAVLGDLNVAPQPEDASENQPDGTGQAWREVNVGGEKTEAADLTWIATFSENPTTTLPTSESSNPSDWITFDDETEPQGLNIIIPTSVSTTQEPTAVQSASSATWSHCNSPCGFTTMIRGASTTNTPVEDNTVDATEASEFFDAPFDLEEGEEKGEDEFFDALDPEVFDADVDEDGDEEYELISDGGSEFDEDVFEDLILNSDAALYNEVKTIAEIATHRISEIVDAVSYATADAVPSSATTDSIGLQIISAFGYAMVAETTTERFRIFNELVDKISDDIKTEMNDAALSHASPDPKSPEDQDGTETDTVQESEDLAAINLVDSEVYDQVDKLAQETNEKLVNTLEAEFGKLLVFTPGNYALQTAYRMLDDAYFAALRAPNIEERRQIFDAVIRYAVDAGREAAAAKADDIGVDVIESSSREDFNAQTSNNLDEQKMAIATDALSDEAMSEIDDLLMNTFGEILPGSPGFAAFDVLSSMFEAAFSAAVEAATIEERIEIFNNIAAASIKAGKQALAAESSKAEGNADPSSSALTHDPDSAVGEIASTLLNLYINGVSVFENNDEENTHEQNEEAVDDDEIDISGFEIDDNVRAQLQAIADEQERSQ
ncbi:hypothetical protein BROUX41_006117 [Berkeleyomyces rouxiae]|uniref:uncharacterized protein n=1 Tax=Berkeleyomyces rouxiae TaxID=2035830 RepID=UPI003B79F5CD